MTDDSTLSAVSKTKNRQTGAEKTVGTTPPAGNNRDTLGRRSFVATVGAGVVTAVSGCIGDDDDDGAGSGGTDVFGDDDSPFSSGDQGSSEADDGDDGAFQGDDDSGDGVGGEDTEAGGFSDEDSHSAMTAGDIRYEPSFIIEGTFQDEQMGQEITVYSRHYHGNYHQKVEMDGMGEMEMYFVDGQTYTIMEDQCFQGQQDMDSPDFDPEIDEEEDELITMMPPEPTGSAVIDGEPVDVYEFEPDEQWGEEEEMTVYIGSDTGYLRRMESNIYSIDYHSWGEVGPISEPDVDCQEMGGGPPSDY